MQTTSFLDFKTQAESIIHSHIINAEPLLLSHQWDKLQQAIESIRQKVKKAGLWAPHLPKDIGGQGLTISQLGELSAVLGRSPLGHVCFGCQAPDAGNAELLHLYADKRIKSEFLHPLAAGDIRSCFAMTEPAMAGSNPTRLSATAELKNGQWHINGHKWFTTGADGADFAIIMAVTEPKAAKHQQASMIIVPTDSPGYALVRNISVMGSEGHGYFSHGEVKFSNVVVPEQNLLGQRGAGFLMAQQRLGPGRIQHCMRWIGIARRCFDIMCRYVNQRQITDQQTLAQQPVMQVKIADSYAAIEAAQYLVQATAERIDKAGYAAAKHDISMIKFHTAQMLQNVMNHAIQALGGLGVTDDTVLSFFYREERAARIYDGPDEVHQLSLAKQLLAQYR
ncbi:MAG: acyl-CoA dehydrogenase [Proteobacteria bacterium]|nr:MAG: acyl-CoA dehydrogenase [Pseudomonadota bacterium]